MDILTVCTGNICRSPLAALILRTRLADLGVTVRSAGVRGLASAEMTPEAVHLAVEYGVSAEDAASHRSRFLTEPMLAEPDLILTMTLEHRRDVAELAPSRLRSTFTAREFGRLAASLTDEEITASIAASTTAEDSSAARLRAAAAIVAAQRGLVPPADDDVVDPYRRSWEVYRTSADQLLPALEQVERVVRLAAR